MILDTIPVLPPDLRVFSIENNEYYFNKVNDSYRMVINRNNRLRRLIELNAPKVIINKEKKMLQETVDTLFDMNYSSCDPEMKSGLQSISDQLNMLVEGVPIINSRFALKRKNARNRISEILWEVDHKNENNHKEYFEIFSKKLHGLCLDIQEY
jgi:hypothetical protein